MKQPPWKSTTSVGTKARKEEKERLRIRRASPKERRKESRRQMAKAHGGVARKDSLSGRKEALERRAKRQTKAQKEKQEPVTTVARLGIAAVAMDLQDDREEKMIQMARTNDDEQASCLVTLDSGADVSVLPKSYAGVGRWSEGSRQLRMVDAQGEKIERNGVTKARVRTTDASGKQIELVEEFVLGNAQRPILCAGKLLRKGWSISSAEDGLNLKHEEKQVPVPINNERNSAILSAHLCGGR